MSARPGWVQRSGRAGKAPVGRCTGTKERPERKLLKPCTVRRWRPPGLLGVDVFRPIVTKTLRVPVSTDATPGEGCVLTRQLDVALMAVGFKLSADLLTRLSALHPAEVADLAARLLPVVESMVGAQHEHNTYFLDFPDNVPDTMEFWTQCIVDALLDPRAAATVSLQLSEGVVNLLDLPSYGRYQHSYQDLVEAHAQFLPCAKDRVTVLHLGGTMAEECQALYLSLAGSTVPLNEADRALLADLAELHLDLQQPERIPVREHRALVNRVRIHRGHAPMVDSVTDVLRLACALSDGDETLLKPTRFRSFRRPVRRVLLLALDEIVRLSPAKLGDVARHREAWKRLGERLHPGEHQQLEGAQDVFAVARGSKRVRSLAGRIELALMAGDHSAAVGLLARAPGVLLRSLDRLLRTPGMDAATLEQAVCDAAARASGRVILQLREQLQSRLAAMPAHRLFVNRHGRAWATTDERAPLDPTTTKRILAVLDQAVGARLPAVEHLVVARQALGLALPLSNKTVPEGFQVLPRGSRSPVEPGLLRFFVYWKQRHERTDFDLACDLLGEDVCSVGHISWTGLKAAGAVHSGDIVDAPSGAFEAIEVDLGLIEARYLVPSVHVFSGEGFLQVEESSFGYMHLQPGQRGMPFEPTTVRHRSELRGEGLVALPVIFERGDDGLWFARWLNFFQKGPARYNTVERARHSISLLLQGFLARVPLTVCYLAELHQAQGTQVTFLDPGDTLPEGPVTFIGPERPEDLPAGSTSFTLSNLHQLIPS